MKKGKGKKSYWERPLIFEILGQLPLDIVLILCAGIAIGVAMVDYLTNQQASIHIFYCVPISIVTWVLGLKYGVLVSAICTTSWIATDYAVNIDAAAWRPQYWDIFVLFVFYSVFAVLIARLRYSIDKEKRLSRTDALTGACNTRCFHELGERELERLRRYDHPFSLAYLDMDKFKLVNDTFGHMAGDMILQEVAATLMRNLRENDVVARLGGDEFVVLFPDTDEEAGGALMEKMLELVNEAIPDKYRGIPSISIGLVTFTRPPATLEDAIRAADLKMYEAKSSNRKAIAHAVV